MFILTQSSVFVTFADKEYIQIHFNYYSIQFTTFFQFNRVLFTSGVRLKQQQIVSLFSTNQSRLAAARSRGFYYPPCNSSMETNRWSVELTISQDEMLTQVQQAAELLKQGEAVAFPTETVYGLGANALSDQAVTKIYQAKGRPGDNPLIIHVDSMTRVRELVTEVPLVAEQLAEAFWPGPLTIILPSRGTISSLATCGLTSVGVRIPQHPVALALLKASGLPLAAPSANLSGRPSPTTGDHVYDDLKGKIAGVVNAGATGVGVESTVVDCCACVADSEAAITILRPGGITREDLSELLGKDRVLVDPSLEVKSITTNPSYSQPNSSSSSRPSSAGSTDIKVDQVETHDEGKSTEEARQETVSDQMTTQLEEEDNKVNLGAVESSLGAGPRAPGMKYTHYAPRAPLWLVQGSQSFLQTQIDIERKAGRRVGVLATDESKDSYHADIVGSYGQRSDPASIARGLFDGLRWLDEQQPPLEVLFSEVFESEGLGHAIMNRLHKAAGHRLRVEEVGNSASNSAKDSTSLPETVSESH